MGKKPIVSVTYENETISIENSLPYLKCVLRLSCVVHGPIYGRFMGCTVNGSLSILMFIHRLPKLDKHRHYCVTAKHKDLYGKKTYRFRNLRKWKDFNKKQLTLHKMCVTSLLCGPWADLWPFYGLYCKRFSLYINVHTQVAQARQTSALLRNCET